jgi:hypothetical protein
MALFLRQREFNRIVDGGAMHGKAISGGRGVSTAPRLLPVQVELAVRSRAIPQIQIDQALIRDAHLFNRRSSSMETMV